MHTASSQELARTAFDGKINPGPLRQGDAEAEPAFRVAVHGPLFARLPAYQTLAERRIIRPGDINGEGFINS